MEQVRESYDLQHKVKVTMYPTFYPLRLVVKWILIAYMIFCGVMLFAVGTRFVRDEWKSMVVVVAVGGYMIASARKRVGFQAVPAQLNFFDNHLELFLPKVSEGNGRRAREVTQLYICPYNSVQGMAFEPAEACINLTGQFELFEYNLPRVIGEGPPDRQEYVPVMAIYTNGCLDGDILEAVQRWTGKQAAPATNGPGPQQH